jgi:tetratricopeptide (TPR) repeat protein
LERSAVKPIHASGGRNLPPARRTFPSFSAAFAAILLGIAFLLPSCSQEKRTWTSLAWHNTLAHYNGYFLAREKMKEYEAEQLLAFKDNYNRVLEVFPFPPPGSGSSANSAMEEVIKKASIPVQRHKNSKWVDDSYLLIGKARFYKEDWENAIQTFKYINTKFTDADVKHSAVIWLLITYTRMGDISNAKSVIAYLKKETLSKQNLKEGALAFAWYYQKRKDYAKMLDYLSMAVELSPRSREKGRLSFALGQLNQKFNKDAEAETAYRTVLKCWPSFDLEFNARMNLAQVVAVSDERQLKKIRKRFIRMTKDLKYEDNLDKIYHTMGLFEIKQNDMKLGITHLRTALKKAKAGSRQKPYTFLKLAELHYSPLRNYVWAKNYYDSTVLGLDTTEDNYKAIVKRQKVLGEFVKHYVTIQTEDSLQGLAKMDSNSLKKLIEQKVKDEQSKAEDAERQARKLARQQAAGGSDLMDNSAFGNLSGGQNTAAAAGGGTWYFSNPIAVANGRTDFRKKWGDRKLEDNWRRSNKQSEFSDADSQDSAAVKKDDGANPDDKAVAGDKAAKADKEKENKPDPEQMKKGFMKNIPISPEQLAESNRRLQEALFEIGKIYDQKLDEPELAIASLERDVKDFPAYEKVPEALYNLCLLYRRKKDNANFERCKSKLTSEFPESVFAKLIVNPNYLQENKQKNEIIGELYRVAYEQYKSSMFIEASNGIASIRKSYPKSDYEDKLAILSALITARTVDIPTYIKELKAFQNDFPKSPLRDFASLCIQNAEKGKGPQVSDSSVAAVPKEVTFNEDLQKKHYFLALIPSLDVPEAQIQAAFSDFNGKFYPGEGLQVTTLPFGDNKHVLLKVQEIPTKIRALYYLKKVQESGPFKKEFKQFKPVFLLATQENMQSLYKSKDLKAYAVFFAKHYDLDKELQDGAPPNFGK